RKVFYAEVSNVGADLTDAAQTQRGGASVSADGPPGGAPIPASSTPPRSPEELVAADPFSPASLGAGLSGSPPAAPLTGPVVQFLTAGLQSLHQVNHYQPFLVQVTLPSEEDAPDGPIEVTLTTPHYLWGGQHTVKLEKQAESGGVVTYRSQLQIWEKQTGFANPFADIPDALDNFFSYLPFFTDDPDWADEPALYQVLAISNGEALQAEFDGSTAQVTVYDTGYQQGIANTERAFGAARQFYTWLGDQLGSLSGGAVVDPNWLEQAKGAFPPGLVPWELTVLGQGGEISAEQVTQLQASVQQKLTYLPQVQASWVELPEGNDIQRYFVGFGLFRTLIGDPATWTVYTGTGHLAWPTYSLPLLSPLPNGFNLAVDAAMRDAEDANRKAAATAFVDAVLAGYGTFVAVSGGESLWTLASTGVASFEATMEQGSPTFVRGTTAFGQTASNWDLFTSTVQVFAEPILVVAVSHHIGPTIAEGKRAGAESQANLRAQSTQRCYQAFDMPEGRVGLGPSGRPMAGADVKSRGPTKVAGGGGGSEPPTDPHDVEAWNKYYAKNPNAPRSLGAAAADDPAVFGGGSGGSVGTAPSTVGAVPSGAQVSLGSPQDVALVQSASQNGVLAVPGSQNLLNGIRSSNASHVEGARFVLRDSVVEIGQGKKFVKFEDTMAGFESGQGPNPIAKQGVDAIRGGEQGPLGQQGGTAVQYKSYSDLNKLVEAVRVQGTKDYSRYYNNQIRRTGTLVDGDGNALNGNFEYRIDAQKLRVNGYPEARIDQAIKTIQKDFDANQNRGGTWRFTVVKGH
ncbi:MAG: hypothetical protein ACREUD_01070, partial [Gammaproteobacteria bacterium]